MIPESIEESYGKPPGLAQNQPAFETDSSLRLNSSPDNRDTFSPEQPRIAAHWGGPFRNKEPVPDENPPQPSQVTLGWSQEEQPNQHTGPPSDPWDTVDADNMEAGEVDARSDASSESDLFVAQDSEIKGEAEREGDRMIDSTTEEGPPVEDDRRHGLEEHGRKESGRLDEYNDLVGGDDERFDGNQGTEGQHNEVQVEAPFGQDDDSDCMVVEASDIPADINAKFSEFEFCKFPQAAGDLVCVGSAQIKREEPDDEFTIPDSDDEDDSDFSMDEDDILSDGEPPRKRRQGAAKRQGKRDEAQLLNPAQAITAAVPETGADGDWEEPTEDELLKIYTEQAELTALKAKGPLTFPQKIALAQVNVKINSIEKMSSQQTKAPELVGPTLVANGGGLDRHQQPPAGVETKQPRRFARTAQEYWEREYAEKGSGIRKMAEATKRKRALKKPKKGRNDGTGDVMELKLFEMLKDVNPVMARAAQGGMAMPGPIQATTRDDQLKAMRDFLFRITGNPGQRGKSDDERLLEKASKSFGHSQVKAENGKWRLAGKRMFSTLYNHQLVGVSWMLSQEFSPDGPYGGILADQMGLGKTVQVLATMSANRPTQADVDAGRHQTLIVAPATAISQWEREVRKHCEKSFIKLVYHYRAVHKLDPDMWKMADVM